MPADLPRVDFFHWVLVDLAADMREIQEGAFSDGITPRGKGGPLAPNNARQGVNDYTGWFAADRDMNGDYFATTVRARPGTTSACTIMCSRCTRWMSPR